MNHSTNPLRRIVHVLAWHEKLLPMLAGCMLISCVAVAAVVSMQAPPSGGELHIPVMLYGDGDESLSGLQFDLNYDTTRFELVAVSSGTAASDAGKEVILTETVPGQGRVLITGFNNTEMYDGHVATVILRPLQSDRATHDFSIDRVLASDPDGNTVPIGYEDLFQFPPAAPEKAEGPDEAPEGPELSANDPDLDEPSDARDVSDPEDATNTTEPSPDPASVTSTDSSATTDTLPSALTVADPKVPTVQGTPQRALPGRLSRPPGAHASTDFVHGPKDVTTTTPSTKSGSNTREASPTHTDTSRRSNPTDLQPATENAPLTEFDTPRRLALATSVSDALSRDGSIMEIGAGDSTMELSPRAWRDPRLAAAAVGPLVFAAMLLIRNLLFGRRAHPTWRRTR